MSDLTARITVRVPESFKKRVKVAAALSGVPLGEFLDTLVTAHERKLRKMPSPLHRMEDE